MADTSTLTKKALQLSVVEGMLHAVMLGTSEGYMGPFAVLLGFDNTELALLQTLPLLFGAVSQLLAPRLSVMLGGRKRLVVAGAALQSLSHLGLWYVVDAARAQFLTFLLLKTAYWVGGLVIVPAWNAWMGNLTEHVPRAHYFGRRHAACQIALLVSYSLSGWYLEHESGAASHHFLLLFGIGFAARFLSAILLARQLDAPEEEQLDFSQQLQLARRHTPWLLIFAAIAFDFSTNVAIPFFSPYMLRELHMGYWTFSALMAAAMLTKVIVFPLWAKWGHKSGMQHVLAIGYLGVVLTAAAWAFSSNLVLLFCAQFFSGAVWAAVELATLQLLLHYSRDSYRLGLMSLVNAGGGLGQLAGSLVGSELLLQGMSYRSVFGISSVLRSLPLLFLMMHRSSSKQQHPVESHSS